MELPHKAFVVVADGRKMLFLRNEGDAAYPNLVVERVREQDALSNGEQPSNEPVTDFSSASSGRSNYVETDFHQLEEDQFAAETAERLKKRALRNDFESLVIIAPPKTLGELRKHYHKEVSGRLIGEIDKDLTGHPVPEIEAALRSA